MVNINLEEFQFMNILLAIFFAILLLYVIHSISNLITKLGVYHKIEPFWFKRLSNLYHTNLFLSIPLNITIFITLSQYIGDDPYRISFISSSASFMFLLIGRVCSLSNLKLFDDDPHREKERMLSSVFSFIIVTLIIAILNLVYNINLYNPTFTISISGTYYDAIVMIFIFFSTPFVTCFVSETILHITGIPEELKINN